jgi:hypothetical protein
MTTRIKLRRDSAANWLEYNPILAAGEPGLETDTGKVKYGDGVTAWALLPHAGSDTLDDQGNVVITAGSTEHWIATQRRERFDTEPRGQRYDSQGNLYVLTETGDDNNDITVITKYTASGAVAWQKSFTDTSPRALAVDSSDCAYITVQPDGPVVAVVKFSTAGAILWQKSYDIGPIEAYGAYIEEKSSSTLALICSFFGGNIPAPTNVLAMEISTTDGSVQIKKSIDLASDDQVVFATGIDVDGDENVFITGYYYDVDDGKNKMFIEKLDENLNRVWSKSLETDNNYNMDGGDCASDALGNIYAVGTYDVDTVNSVDGTTSRTAAVLVKLNSSGVVQWTRRISGPCANVVAGLTATATGDVYLSSVTFVVNATGNFAQESELEQEAYGSRKMVVVRYNTQGAVVWQRYVDLGQMEESSYDGGEMYIGQAVAVFGDKFAVSGYGYSTNYGPTNYGSSADNEADYFVVQLPTDGTELTIGDLSFTESRIPGRFVTHESSNSPLVIADYSETILAEDAELTADTNTRVSNSIVNSETYQYKFGADGTLTVPNDGDIKLTQSQVGYFVAVGRTYNDDDDIMARATAVDSFGNLYLAGRDGDRSQPFVMKISPEGDRLWGVTIEEDSGDDGWAWAVSVHPTTGNVMVLAEMYGEYTYSILVTMDQDTGRILDHEKFSDSTADVVLHDMAWTSTGTYVLGGEKLGEFGDEITVVPQTGSTTGTILVLRSAVDSEPSTSWQIGGTGFSVFEEIDYIERYTGLTGTVRQGSGATFDIINNGNGTYSASVVNGGTNYLPGHKIKILGTSLTGAENTSTFTSGAEYTAGQVNFAGTGGIFAPWYVGVNSALTSIISLITTGTTLTLTVGGATTSTSVVTVGEFEGNALYEVGDLSVFGSSGTSIDSITVSNGTYASGATPANDIILTVASVDAGAITLVTNSGTAAGTSGATATAVTGTNYEVGSGFELTFESSRYSNLYTDHNYYNITNQGSNYVENDIIVIAGTSLGGTTPANDLTVRVYASGGTVGYVNEFSGTSQSTTWKFETTTQVDFAGTGTWNITYPLSEESVLITPSWQRTFGTSDNYSDRIGSVALDTSNNIIAVGKAAGTVSTSTTSIRDLAVVYKFNSEGTLLWTRQLNDQNDDCYARSVVTIGTDIYVAHYSDDDGDTVVTKLDASGNIKWQRITNSDDDTCIARTVDGDLIVISEAYYNFADDDGIKIIRFSPNGEVVYKRWLTATTNDDTYLATPRGLTTDAHSFYIGAYFDTDNYESGLAVRLPLDGSGTGEHGSFSYVDVNNETSNWLSTGIEDENFTVGEVDLESENNYAGPLADSNHPYINTGTTVTVGTGDFYVDSYYPGLTVEPVRDTDGGSIVFADGSKQSTSATDIPQRIYTGQRYTLSMKDRGHHILCDRSDDDIVIPYNARVPFPIGTVITIVNRGSNTINISKEGGSIEVMLAGDGFYSYFDLAPYGVATLLKIGIESWMISGNVQVD